MILNAKCFTGMFIWLNFQTSRCSGKTLYIFVSNLMHWKYLFLTDMIAQSFPLFVFFHKNCRNLVCITLGEHFPLYIQLFCFHIYFSVSEGRSSACIIGRNKLPVHQLAMYYSFLWWSTFCPSSGLWSWVVTSSDMPFTGALIIHYEP